MTEIRKCTICGKPYEQKEYGACGHTFKVWVAQCECEEIERQRQEEIKKEQERIEKARQKAEIIKEQLNSPLISPYYQQKTFDKLSDCNKNVKSCQKYAQDFKRKTSTGIFMIGNVGTGKTTLQACICNELSNRGYICLLTHFSALLDIFIDSCSFNTQISTNQLFKTLTCFDYVVLDDIGREKYTDKRLEFAFRIIDTLMDNKIVTSVTCNPEIIAKLSKIPEYKAIIDRLKNMCGYNMRFEGESYRGKYTKIAI